MPTAGTRKAHSDAPGEDAVRETKRHLGWPEDKSFYVPAEALIQFRKAIDKGETAEAEWNAFVEKYEQENGDLAAQWRSTMSGELPAGWEDHLPSFDDAKPMATRVASGEVINALNAPVRCFMADFEDSCAPTWENLIRGQVNLADAVRRTISYEDPATGKVYRLSEHTATLIVRPRGWHLPEKHVRNRPTSAKLMPNSFFQIGSIT